MMTTNEQWTLQRLRRVFRRHYGSLRLAAKKAGVSPAYITRILKGHRKSDEVMAVLCEVASTLNAHSKPVLYRNGVMTPRVFSDMPRSKTAP